MKKKMTIFTFLLALLLQVGLFSAQAEVSLPNPSLPNPSLPNPSLPNTSLPNPSLSDSNLSNSSHPGTDVESSEGGGNEDGTSKGEDKGWIDSLTDFAQSVGDKLDGFTQNTIETLGDIGSSILDGLAEAGQWIADNWELTAAVVAGVGLTIAGIFVAPLLPFGLAILAGIAISGGIGYFSGLRGEDLTKEMGIGGALGAIGGGVLGIVGKVAGAGLKTLVTGNALSGAITSMADDTLHNRKISIPKAVIGAALGVGLTALMLGGQGLGLGNKLMNLGLVSKPSVSSQKVDVPDGAGKGSGTVVGEGSSGITVSEQSLKHSTIGDFTFNPKTGAVSRMKGGGHGQSNINFLEEHGIEYNIEKIYPNGVRIGNIPLHKTSSKRVGTNQAWFPESWTDTNIQKAGEYVANLPENIGLENGVTMYGNFNGVRVGVIKTDGKIGTIFPDAIQQP